MKVKYHDAAIGVVAATLALVNKSRGICYVQSNIKRSVSTKFPMLRCTAILQHVADEHNAVQVVMAYVHMYD